MKIGEYSFEVSNTDKIIFPGAKITKGELIDYYAEVAPWFVPLAKGRPVSLKRFPGGITQKPFYQKSRSAHFPEWIESRRVPREKGDIDMILIENEATLVYLGNQVCSIHTWLSKVDNTHHPDKMIIDLDPDERKFNLVCEAAMRLRQLMEEELGLPVFVMTTGSKGLHLVVPVKTEFHYDQVRDFARKLCNYLAAAFPEEFTTEVRKDKRTGRLFLDYLRNGYAQTGIAPYSIRSLQYAPVATPLYWEELKDHSLDSRTYHLRNIMSKLKEKGDPWEEFDRKRISLASSMEKLEEMNL
jgi:bifunctional non-homologous end joining protein LigD